MPRNGNPTLLRGMFVLAMASLLGHLAPPIAFNSLDDIPNLQTFALLGAAFFRLDARRLST